MYGIKVHTSARKGVAKYLSTGWLVSPTVGNWDTLEVVYTKGKRHIRIWVSISNIKKLSVGEIPPAVIESCDVIRRDSDTRAAELVGYLSQLHSK